MKNIVIFLIALFALAGCREIGDEIAVIYLDCSDRDIQNMIAGDSQTSERNVHITGDLVRTDTFNFFCEKEVIQHIHRTANRYQTVDKGEKGIPMKTFTGQPYRIIKIKKRVDFSWSIYSVYGEWYLAPSDTLGFTYDYEGSLNHGEVIPNPVWNVRTETLPVSQESFDRIAVLAATFHKFKSTSAVGYWNPNTQRYEDGPVSLTEKHDSRGNYWLYIRDGKVWGEWLSAKKSNLSYTVNNTGSVFSNSILFTNTKVVVTERLPNNAASQAKIKALAATFDKAHSRTNRDWSFVQNQYRKGNERLIKKTDNQGIYWLHTKGGKMWGEWVVGDRKNIDGDVS